MQNPKTEHSQIPILFVTVPLHHLKANIQNKELCCVLQNTSEGARPA
jgi:hypothetical protein